MAKPSRNISGDIERRVEVACKRISERSTLYLEKIIEEGLSGTVNHDPRIVLMAIREVMDRGLGKAKQQVDQNINIKGGDALVEAINAAKERVLEKTTAIIKEQIPTRH